MLSSAITKSKGIFSYEISDANFAQYRKIIDYFESQLVMFERSVTIAFLYFCS